MTKKVIRLLVVDDDENILDRIIEHFKDRFIFDGVPVEMIAAVDGETALKILLNEGPFDALITDLFLPKMDGLAVCREVKEKAPHIPIIMLTGKDGSGTDVKYRRSFRTRLIDPPGNSVHFA